MNNYNIELLEPKIITYFDLFPLLKSLKSERNGIEKRVWDFLSNKDVLSNQFRPIKGRILNINLYYFGIGDEYPTKYIKDYPDELDHSMKTFPESFIEGSDKELRLDFNLITSLYEHLVENIEAFPVMIDW